MSSFLPPKTTDEIYKPQSLLDKYLSFFDGYLCGFGADILDELEYRSRKLSSDNVQKLDALEAGFLQALDDGSEEDARVLFDGDLRHVIQCSCSDDDVRYVSKYFLARGMQHGIIRDDVTFLSFAVRERLTKVIKFLQPNVHEIRQWHYRIVRDAAECGNTQIFKYLWTRLPSAARNDACEDIFGRAVTFGHVAIVKYLWSQSPDLAHIRAHRYSGFVRAAGNCQMSVVKFLWSVMTVGDKHAVTNRIPSSIARKLQRDDAPRRRRR